MSVTQDVALSMMEEGLKNQYLSNQWTDLDDSNVIGKGVLRPFQKSMIPWSNMAAMIQYGRQKPKSEKDFISATIQPI